ncbi:hypothetical protein EDC01DRAFT_732498 [Geopyxis carbonaria]|nr:hypothetical protein EDC01DRAFT_732498 [Geopyxis carbonaria]
MTVSFPSDEFTPTDRRSRQRLYHGGARYVWIRSWLILEVRDERKVQYVVLETAFVDVVSIQRLSLRLFNLKDMEGRGATSDSTTDTEAQTITRASAQSDSIHILLTARLHTYNNISDKLASSRCSMSGRVICCGNMTECSLELHLFTLSMRYSILACEPGPAVETGKAGARTYPMMWAVACADVQSSFQYARDMDGIKI